MQKFFKTKAGFTLVELIIVVLILGVLVAIAIPVYSAVMKQSKAKICETVVNGIASDVKNYCIENAFNENYTFKIKSIADENTGVLLDASGNEITKAEDISLLRDDVFKGDIPYCPSNGTYTIKIEEVVTGIPKIEVTCDADH